MEIQCECGKFRAELTHLPKNTPGRLKCYCDDCQAFLHYIKRTDLLDKNGGSEVIPVYPGEIKITTGKEFIQCVRLSEKGMYRYSTTCCNTPIANTDPKSPWAGIHSRMFTAKDANQLEKLGPIKSSVMGKYAKGTPPPGTPQKFNFAGMKVVFPYLLKGVILGKAKGSPFFENGQSVATPKILSNDERQAALKLAGF